MTIFHKQLRHVITNSHDRVYLKVNQYHEPFLYHKLHINKNQNDNDNNNNHNNSNNYNNKKPFNSNNKNKTKDSPEGHHRQWR